MVPGWPVVDVPAVPVVGDPVVVDVPVAVGVPVLEVVLLGVVEIVLDIFLVLSEIAWVLLFIGQVLLDVFEIVANLLPVAVDRPAITPDVPFVAANVALQAIAGRRRGGCGCRSRRSGCGGRGCARRRDSRRGRGCRRSGRSPRPGRISGTVIGIQVGYEKTQNNCRNSDGEFHVCFPPDKLANRDETGPYTAGRLTLSYTSNTMRQDSARPLGYNPVKNRDLIHRGSATEKHSSLDETRLFRSTGDFRRSGRMLPKSIFSQAFVVTPIVARKRRNERQRKRTAVGWLVAAGSPCRAAWLPNSSRSDISSA